MLRCLGLALTCGLLVAADNEEATKKEYARFEGVWRFALVEVDGKKQPEAPFETNKLIVLKDGRYVIVQGDRITHGTLKLDPTQTPKHYDVAVTNGPVKGLMVSGIYEIDGDTYKICLPLRGNDRPAAFDNKPGGGCLIHVFKREKQDVKEALTAAGRKELAGRWQAVTYALNGNKASDEDMKKIQLVIDAEGKTRAINEGKVFIASTTKIDPTAKPMTIDLSFTEGDPKGKIALGIYKIEDDVLTICRAAPDKARPTEFASKPDSGHTLMTYKREKAEKKRE
jgi:uncharacterized protein (TIGR03067 family)